MKSRRVKIGAALVLGSFFGIFILLGIAFVNAISIYRVIWVLVVLGSFTAGWVFLLTAKDEEEEESKSPAKKQPPDINVVWDPMEIQKPKKEKSEIPDIWNQKVLN